MNHCLLAIKPNKAQDTLVLGDLLDFSKPISFLMDSLKGSDWSFAGKPVTMKQEHIKRVLLRYIQGHLTAEDIENWANLIEGREDIDFEPDHEEVIGECVHELANPSLTHELSVQRATELLSLLRSL
ncbi:MAG: hypothetical protein LBF16_04820 [Pseudomonadales bacterium]|jgi:Na+/phosphate symporter|nr:hypothetical protein [Pseudomonadales bacterium]